jgi:cyclopropane fatty-acyl-phospholipid synthase-like methyltransferase
MSPRTKASWKGFEADSVDGTKEFWSKTSMEELQKMMGTSWKKWTAWLDMAAKVIKEPGSVFEPGCGPSYLADIVVEKYGCTYYGCDINQEFLDVAAARLEQKGLQDKAVVEYADLYAKLDLWERDNRNFDWVIVTSLFGMFPEDESYRLLSRFWDRTDKGMTITTLNKKKYDETFKKKRKNHLTSHDPEELKAFIKALPGVSSFTLAEEVKDGNLNRKMVGYIYR